MAVHVAFRYQGVDWTRDFHVEEGATLRQLKETMVRPEGGSKADVDAFELRLRGHRVFEFEQIWEECWFEFMYLGPEEGGRRAGKDFIAQESYERATRAEEERRRREEADRRRREEEAQRQRERDAERERKKAEEKAAKESARAPKQVDVTVKHAVPEMASQITVSVLSNATVLDVRLAVMTALGEKKLSEIKLIKRHGGTLTTLSNETPMGGTREFLCMGRLLRPDGEGDDPEFKVTSIQDYTELDVKISAEKTVKDLKARVCEQAQRGPLSHVQLWMGERELKDGEKLGPIAQQCDMNLIIAGISLGPPRPVDVQVTHGSSGHQVRLSVQDTLSMRELREAVAAAAGGSLSDVRIVKRLAGGHWQSLPDSERLNGRTEFSCMGSVLERPPGAPPEPVFEDVDLTVSICLDTSLGISQDVSVKKGSSIYALKEVLAGTDPTHRTKPEDFGLSLQGAPERPLPDATRITEEHLLLNLLAGMGAEAAPAAEPRSVAGRWRMRCRETGEITHFTFKQAAGSEKFTGKQDGGAVVTDGRIHGSTIHWRIEGVLVEGSLSDDWRSMPSIVVKTESGDLIASYSGDFVGPA